jgi:hypothetical protein
MAQAALDGVGIAFTFEEHVAPLLAKRHLVRVLEERDSWPTRRLMASPAAARRSRGFCASKTVSCVGESYRSARILGFPYPMCFQPVNWRVYLPVGRVGQTFCKQILQPSGFTGCALTEGRWRGRSIFLTKTLSSNYLGASQQDSTAPPQKVVRGLRAHESETVISLPRMGQGREIAVRMLVPGCPLWGSRVSDNEEHRQLSWLLQLILPMSRRPE